MGHVQKILTQRAKSLRKDATPSEKLLWSQLRQKRFGGVKFRRQQPIGPYIVDFFSSEARLVIELDGESHVGRERHDTDRQAYLERQGLTVMRFWDSDVFANTDGVLQMIYEHCRPFIAEARPETPIRRKRLIPYPCERAG